MQDRSLNIVGGICAILLGIITATTAITYLLLPPEQRAAVPAPEILPSLAQNPTPLLLELWQMTITGVLGLAVVPAFTQLVRGGNEGWVRWTSNLAFLGFSVAAVSNALTAGRLPGLASAYVAGDDSTKAALAPIWRSSLDLQALWQYGAVGVWILAVSVFALRGKILPTNLAYVGMALGVLHLFVPVALLLKNQPFILAVAGLSAILAPIWYIWAGLDVRRRA